MDSCELTETPRERQPALIVDFQKVRSPNPHRYVLGFYKGWSGSDKVFGGTEYDKGFDEGAACRKGAPMPAWCFCPEVGEFEDDSSIFDYTDHSVS